MRIIYVAGIVLFYAAATFAQGTLTGTVSDAATGEKLPGATVFIPDLHTGATTDENGQYAMAKIPRGRFKVQYSYVGFETEVRTVDFDGSGQTIDVVLNPTVIEAHGIVVSTAFTTSEDENPVKVEQLSAEQITKSGSPTMMEALAQLPGVAQVTTGVSTGKPVIRGLSYNRVVVFSEGVRVENQQWGDEHGLGLNDMGIERVEIIKGPSSLIYGSDAMGGVMHLIDEKPADVGKVVGDYNLKAHSNTLGYSSNLGIKGSGKTFRWKLRGGSESHADYRAGNGPRATNSRFGGNSLKASAGFNTKWLVSSLSYTYLASKVGLPEEIGEQNTARQPLLPNQDLESHILSSQNTFFWGLSKIKLTAGYIANARKEFGEENAAGPVLDMHLSTLSYDLKWHLPHRGKTEAILGVQSIHQTNRNAGPELLIPDAIQTDIGASAMGKLDLKKLTLQAGARYDLRQTNTSEMGTAGEKGYFAPVSRQFGSANGALGGTYNVSEKLLLRLNIASGFRAPNLAELTSNGVHEGTNRFEIGNSGLNNEQNIEADLSAHFHTAHMTTDLAVFRNHISRYIFLAPLDTIIEDVQAYRYLQSDAVLRGAELSMDAHPHPLDWLHLEAAFSFVNGQQDNGDPLPLIPPFRTKVGLRAELPKKGRFSETYLHVGYEIVQPQTRVALFETTTPSYYLLSVGAGTKLKIGRQRLEFYLSASNLLDVDYYDHLSRLKANGIANMGRNFMVGLKVPFGLKN